MLITKEEFDIEIARKNAQLKEYRKALDDTMKELVEAQQSLKGQQAAADDGYYIHVPVERECLSCPKLALETVHEAAVIGSVAIHQCKHIEFCKQIRRNWEEVHEINCGDKDTQT